MKLTYTNRMTRCTSKPLPMPRGIIELRNKFPYRTHGYRVCVTRAELKTGQVYFSVKKYGSFDAAFEAAELYLEAL